MFKDREAAGEALAERLECYRGARDVLVLGLPRGGVITASAISKRLGLPLDVLVSQKLRCPDDPELAFGAVTELGNAYFDPRLAPLVKPAERDEELAFERKEALWRRRLYRGDRPLPDVRGRRLILVDDGIATGATFIAAIEALRTVAPGRIVAAAGVGQTDVVKTVAAMADETQVVEVLEELEVVGACFESFPPLHDWEVVARLSAGHARRMRNRGKEE